MFHFSKAEAILTGINSNFRAKNIWVFSKSNGKSHILSRLGYFIVGFFAGELTLVHFTVNGRSPLAEQVILTWESLMAALIFWTSVVIFGGTLTVMLTITCNGWPTPFVTWHRYWPWWLLSTEGMDKIPMGLTSSSRLVLKISPNFPGVPMSERNKKRLSTNCLIFSKDWGSTLWKWLVL